MNLAFGIGLTLVTCARLAHAQGSPDKAALDRVKALAERSVEVFRGQVQGILTDRERAIEASIEYRVLARPWANARAFEIRGARSIEVGAGMLMVYELISVALAAPKLGSPDCAKRYLSEFLEQFSTADYVADSGRTPARMIDIFEFARRRPRLCSGISFERFSRDDSIRSYQEALLGQSFGWLLAHELGHHLYKANRPDLDHYGLSRENEKLADAFAMRFVSRHGYAGIALALPAMLGLSALGSTAEQESTSSHPSGFRRALIMIEALRELASRDPDFRKQLRGKEAEWQEFIDDFHQALSDALSGK